MVSTVTTSRAALGISVVGMIFAGLGLGFPWYEWDGMNTMHEHHPATSTYNMGLFRTCVHRVRLGFFKDCSSPKIHYGIENCVKIEKKTRAHCEDDEKKAREFCETETKRKHDEAKGESSKGCLPTLFGDMCSVNGLGELDVGVLYSNSPIPVKQKESLAYWPVLATASLRSETCGKASTGFFFAIIVIVSILVTFPMNRKVRNGYEAVGVATKFAPHATAQALFWCQMWAGVLAVATLFDFLAVVVPATVGSGWDKDAYISENTKFWQTIDPNSKTIPVKTEFDAAYFGAGLKREGFIFMIFSLVCLIAATGLAGYTMSLIQKHQVMVEQKQAADGQSIGNSAKAES